MQKRALWRENAHFIDADHTFRFRYFSFVLVNDKLTLCLQGIVTVTGGHANNKHYSFAGFRL
ncbi:hypothetical protein FJMB80182_46910 [Enterobacter hormaechei]|uniref:Uncharacterized protein n=1 Tax=Enterobacter cloacae TaxID=550 RepID=A0ABD0BMX9_ENTCL|nr:hypothetical protein FJMB80063_45740 [Enterobacter hormaechei]GJJ81379.1 hypothetical protein TUM16652_00780 [Enterobacter cloacae]BDK32948.1 hypothetical protein FJMB80068_45120 [Enterobacter hormaechei]BDK38151.1 hypothetical protein FJMB80144_46620 [Enterobacter hormaechei]BDK48564.1 hypothetical protein FJMB80146_46730 [Enterobacter hormaechei]